MLGTKDDDYILFDVGTEISFVYSLPKILMELMGNRGNAALVELIGATFRDAGHLHVAACYEMKSRFPGVKTLQEAKVIVDQMPLECQQSNEGLRHGRVLEILAATSSGDEEDKYNVEPLAINKEKKSEEVEVKEEQDDVEHLHNILDFVSVNDPLNPTEATVNGKTMTMEQLSLLQTRIGEIQKKKEQVMKTTFTHPGHFPFSSMSSTMMYMKNNISYYIVDDKEWFYKGDHWNFILRRSGSLGSRRSMMTSCSKAQSPVHHVGEQQNGNQQDLEDHTTSNLQGRPTINLHGPPGQAGLSSSDSQVQQVVVVEEQQDNMLGSTASAPASSNTSAIIIPHEQGTKEASHQEAEREKLRAATGSALSNLSVEDLQKEIDRRR